MWETKAVEASKEAWEEGSMWSFPLINMTTVSYSEKLLSKVAVLLHTILEPTHELVQGQ